MWEIRVSKYTFSLLRQPLSHSSIFFPSLLFVNLARVELRIRGVAVCQYWPFPPPPPSFEWLTLIPGECFSLERELEMPSSQFPRLLKSAGKHDFVFPTFTTTCTHNIFFSFPLFFLPGGWIISWALPPKTYRQSSRSHAHKVYSLMSGNLSRFRLFPFPRNFRRRKKVKGRVILFAAVVYSFFPD